jgi:hypothetical protein
VERPEPQMGDPDGGGLGCESRARAQRSAR